MNPPAVRLSEEGRATVLAQVAALRRRGQAPAQTLKLVAEGLTDAEGAAELRQLAETLDRGELPRTEELFTELLVAGERCGPEVLEQAAAAYAAHEAHRKLRAAFWGPLLFAVAGFLAIGALLGTVFADRAVFGGVSVPGYTEWVLGLLELLAMAAPIAGILLAAALTGLLRPKRKLSLAARLRLQAAALNAGIPEERVAAMLGGNPLASDALSGSARTYVTLRRGSAGPAAVAERLAGSLERGERRRARVLTSLAPLFSLAFALLVLAPIAIGLILPIFGIAGAIQ